MQRTRDKKGVDYTQTWKQYLRGCFTAQVCFWVQLSLQLSAFQKFKLLQDRALRNRSTCASLIPLQTCCRIYHVKDRFVYAARLVSPVISEEAVDAESLPALDSGILWAHFTDIRQMAEEAAVALIVVPDSSICVRSINACSIPPSSSPVSNILRLPSCARRGTKRASSTCLLNSRGDTIDSLAGVMFL